jgi:hypothetical protein
MLKKFNLLCEATLDKLGISSSMERRFEKCKELYKLNVNLDDLTPEQLNVINDKINEQVKKACKGSVTGRAVEYCISLTFWHEGQWVHQSFIRCDEVTDTTAKFVIPKNYFSKTAIHGEFEVDFNDIIISSGCGGLTTKTVLEIETNKIFDQKNSDDNKNIKFPEDLTEFIEAGLIDKEAILKAFFHKKESIKISLNLKNVMDVENGEELLKKYFNVDTTEGKFKEAVKDSRLPAIDAAHSYTIHLALDVLIKFDQNKTINEQEFETDFNSKYSHHEPSHTPGF